jgi:hypothetical protein
MVLVLPIADGLIAAGEPGLEAVSVEGLKQPYERNHIN